MDPKEKEMDRNKEKTAQNTAYLNFFSENRNAKFFSSLF